MKTFVALDIETSGIPEAAERLYKPEEYKTPGNIKDPAKLSDHRAKWEADQVDAKTKFIERAALSPLTGKIVVIGLIDDEGAIIYLEGDEKKVITDFWAIVDHHENAVTKFVFWSGSGAAQEAFDMDFIVTRSRILGIKLPHSVRNGRFYGNRFIDLASEFLLYRSGAYLSLTNVAELFGLFDGVQTPPVTRKSEADEVTGATFAKVYAEGEEGRAKALGYLANDLALTLHVARRILLK